MPVPQQQQPFQHYNETDRTQLPFRQQYLNGNRNNYQLNNHKRISQVKETGSSHITSSTAYESSRELWGCTPLQVVQVIKFLIILVAIGAVLGIILSSIGAAHNGDDWMGDQPGETFILFILDIGWSFLILVVSLIIIVNLYRKQFSLGIKLEIDMCLVIAFLICSLTGGIIISTIDQTSAISYSCSQVYSKIWPNSLLSQSQIASDNLCTSTCACNYSATSQANYPISGTFSTTGPVNAIGCSSYSPLSSEILSKLKNMEVNWKCAGICEISNKYLFSDVNRGQPNQTASCFKIASQKLYPLRNLFLVGDFAISLIQLAALILLLSMKKFLARDDVRFAHNTIPLQKEKEQLYESNIIANKQKPKEQHIPINQDPNNSSVIRDQSLLIPNNNQRDIYIEPKKEPEQIRPVAPFVAESNPQPYYQIVHEDVSPPPQQPPIYVKETMKEMQPPLIEQGVPAVAKPPVQRQQTVKNPAPLVKPKEQEAPSPMSYNQYDFEIPIIDSGVPSKNSSQQQQQQQPNLISKNNNPQIPIIDSGVPSKNINQQPKYIINNNNNNPNPNLDNQFEIPIIDSGVPSKQLNNKPTGIFDSPVKGQSDLNSSGGNSNSPIKPRSHLLSNPNAFPVLANSGNAVLNTPTSARLGPEGSNPSARLDRQPPQQQPLSSRSFLQGDSLENNLLGQNKDANSSLSNNGNQFQGKKFFKQNNNGQDKFDI